MSIGLGEVVLAPHRRASLPSPLAQANAGSEDLREAVSGEAAGIAARVMHNPEMELTPTQRLLIKTASPRVASLVQWWEERQKLKQARYLSFVDIVEARDLGALDDLLRRAALDDGLGDFVEAVVDHVTNESAREKVEAFGHLLRMVAEDIDGASVDEAWLLLNAIADLDPPHVRVLRRLSRDGNRYQGIRDYELAAMFPNGVALMYPMLKTLERHGLAGVLHPAEAGDPDSPVEWAIWDFGVLLLNRLFPE